MHNLVNAALSNLPTTKRSSANSVKYKIAITKTKNLSFVSGNNDHSFTGYKVVQIY